MSRAVLRSVLELRAPVTRLPPTFLLPSIRFSPARFFNTTAQIVEPDSSSAVTDTTIKPQAAATTSTASYAPTPRSPPTAASTPAPSTPFAPSPTVQALLPLLAAQPGGHYIRAHIHGFPYLVTVGDQVRLPFKMPGVVPGDVLRLNRASVLGSRDFTLKGSPYVDERLFECRAVMTGTESEPMRTKIKTKRRNRKTKHVTSKHRYTILRISELKINEGADIEA